MAHWKKRETTFAEYEVEVSLPGAWQLRPGEAPMRWHYRSADKREQITISRLEEGSDSALKTALPRHRRAVELGFGRMGRVELSEPEFGERGGLSVVSLSGAADAGAIRFHSLLVLIDGAVWTFFHETLRLPEAEALEKAEAIWETIRQRR